MSLYIGEDADNNSMLHITSTVESQDTLLSSTTLPGTIYNSKLPMVKIKKLDIPIVLSYDTDSDTNVTITIASIQNDDDLNYVLSKAFSIIHMGINSKGEYKLIRTLTYAFDANGESSVEVFSDDIFVHCHTDKEEQITWDMYEVDYDTSHATSNEILIGNGEFSVSGNSVFNSVFFVPFVVNDKDTTVIDTAGNTWQLLNSANIDTGYSGVSIVSDKIYGKAGGVEYLIFGDAHKYNFHNVITMDLTDTASFVLPDVGANSIMFMYAERPGDYSYFTGSAVVKTVDIMGFISVYNDGDSHSGVDFGYVADQNTVGVFSWDSTGGDFQGYKLKTSETIDVVKLTIIDIE